jgi:hypothetical protein
MGVADTRHKNANWRLPETVGWEHVSLAVLMDIRDELQEQNRHMRDMLGLARCYRIPRALDAVYRMHRDGVKRRVVRKRRKK